MQYLGDYDFFWLFVVKYSLFDEMKLYMNTSWLYVFSFKISYLVKE